MLKRIVTLSAAAVCLAAALLVIYNFTTVKHAEHAAKFAATAYECSASFEPSAESASHICGEERNPVRLLACATAQDDTSAPEEHKAPEARPHDRNGDEAPHTTVRHERPVRREPRSAMPRGQMARLPFPARWFGEHGFILLFLPLPAPCPPVHKPEAPETPDTGAPEQPVIPDEPQETPEAPPTADEQPTVVDEAEEPATE